MVCSPAWVLFKLIFEIQHFCLEHCIYIFDCIYFPFVIFPLFVDLHLILKFKGNERNFFLIIKFSFHMISLLLYDF